jgi:hypothetical protein
MHCSRNRVRLVAALLLLSATVITEAAGQAGGPPREGAIPVPAGSAGVGTGSQAAVGDTYLEQAALWLQPPAVSTPSSPVRPAAPAAPRRTPYANIRLASVPNMFGDTEEGGCGGLFIAGSLVASLEHPTYACSRLNIAENNSPIVRDRVYYSFRHFANATDIDAFSYSPQGRAAKLDIERQIFGFEKLLTDSLSVEMRLPVNKQLTSNINILQTDSDSTTNGSNINFDQVLNNQPTRIGNIDLILKQRLADTGTFYLSGGLGFNLPTAQSVRVTGLVNDPNYQIYDPNLTLAQNTQHGPANGPVPTGTSVLLRFNGLYSNQTVNLLPFLAFVWTPTENWFSQGFAQVDLPLNESTGTLGLKLVANGMTFADNLADPARARLAEQTLLRLNYGFGRWLYRSNDGFLTALAAVIEFHYTTTLNNSDIVPFSLVQPNQIPLPVLDRGLTLGFGNLDNRIDVVNTVVGFPMYLGMTSLYNGFVFPISPHRGFDFEYMFSVNRRF